jgi:hypothetical protein
MDEDEVLEQLLIFEAFFWRVHTLLAGRLGLIWVMKGSWFSWFCFLGGFLPETATTTTT